MRNSVSIPIVWIVGESVLMEGIATSLEGKKNINLVRWEKMNPAFVDKALTMKPTMIIFELDTPESSELLDLLKGQSGIQMLGIDRECGQVVVLSSYRKQSRTIVDLFEIVQEVGKTAE